MSTEGGIPRSFGCGAVKPLVCIGAMATALKKLFSVFPPVSDWFSTWAKSSRKARGHCFVPTVAQLKPIVNFTFSVMVYILWPPRPFTERKRSSPLCMCGSNQVRFGNAVWKCVQRIVRVLSLIVARSFNGIDHFLKGLAMQTMSFE